MGQMVTDIEKWMRTIVLFTNKQMNVSAVKKDDHSYNFSILKKAFQPTKHSENVGKGQVFVEFVDNVIVSNGFDVWQRVFNIFQTFPLYHEWIVLWKCNNAFFHSLSLLKAPHYVLPLTSNSLALK